MSIFDWKQMTHRLKLAALISWLPILWLGTMGAYLPSLPVAHAELLITMESVSATAGSSGNAFDVELINTGLAAVAISAFTFNITTANPNISFTDANTATVLAPYIFAGNSALGPDLSGPTSGQSLAASDTCSLCASINLAGGTTVGLGHVLFDVSSSASGGVFVVNFEAPPTTGLADPSGGVLPIALQPGEITIPGAIAVGEPASLLLLFAGLTLVIGFKRDGQIS